MWRQGLPQGNPDLRFDGYSHSVGVPALAGPIIIPAVFLPHEAQLRTVFPRGVDRTARPVEGGAGEGGGGLSCSRVSAARLGQDGHVRLPIEPPARSAFHGADFQDRGGGAQVFRDGGNFRVRRR
jgi:hypothetical protein